MRALWFRAREQAFLLKQESRLSRLAAYRRPGGDLEGLLAAVRAKNLVLTVTAGRTGTTYLRHLLALCPETTSQHEPEPSFVLVLRLAQHRPGLARTFLLEYKLPLIARTPTRNYVETGHLFCKGFLEPLLDLGIVPRLIALRRDPRAVATSLLARRTVPGRGKLGLKYLLHPGDPGVLPLPAWMGLTDYQLCFWYALEIERRQRDYTARFGDMSATCVDITAEELHDPARFLAVVEALDLCDDRTDRAALLRGHAEISAATHNPRPDDRLLTDLDAQEAAVWAAVAIHDPTLRDRVESRYESQRLPSDPGGRRAIGAALGRPGQN